MIFDTYCKSYYGLETVIKKSKCVVDVNDNIIVDCIYDNIWLYKNYIIVEIYTKYSILNRSGVNFLQFTFDAFYGFDNEYLLYINILGVYSIVDIELEIYIDKFDTFYNIVNIITPKYLKNKARIKKLKHIECIN